MKYILILIAALSLGACRSLQSVTYIEPAQAFSLGEGRHGSYVANIQNIGPEDIEVLVRQPDSQVVSLGLLQKAGKGHYDVPANTQVIFKNTSEARQGIIQIRLKGDTDLSMGYIRE
ncbi:MAG: hypothetical protein SF053_17970 [Bacteroidia bacterium]|nr:hypothetical protein [Bacteroidia bacterium]